MNRVVHSLSDLMTGTSSVGHIPLFHATGGWKSVDRGAIDVRSYGAVGDNATDNTSAIQAAIDAAYTAGGQPVYFPPGIYISGALTLQYRVSLIGSSRQPGSIASGSVLKLKPGANAPLITTDQTHGSIAGTSVIGGGNQLQQNSSIENLGLDGNKANQTSMDADIVRALQVWGLTIKNCAAVNARGFGLRALDCNVLTLQANEFLFAPIYLESLADSQITANQMGGGNGYAYPVMWLASAGEVCWQNIVTGNIIFNNASNTAVAFPTATFDATADEATTSASHGWVDGTPVIVMTSGTLPGGIAAGTTYYVKSTGSATLKLATTRANLSAGTYVDITDAGSGTHTILVGENCGVYLSDAATKWNIFGNNRIDQHYGHGVVCEGIENTFADNTIVGSGLNNLTGKHGIHFQNGAVRNIVSGGVISGTVYASGGHNTNQVIGVYADATSYDTRIAPGTHIYSHSAANVQLVNYSGSHETIGLGSDRFEVMSGSVAIGTVGGGRRNAWLFDASSEEIIGTELQLPIGWRTIKISLWWVNAGAGSGDVVWNAGVGVFGSGGDLNTADSLSASTTGTAGAQDILVKTVLSSLNVDEGELVFLRVKRVAADAADTLANDAGLVLVQVERG